jgi:hypothetical protein
MFGILKDESEIYTAELKAPSGFSESQKVIGDYNTTLRGANKRTIKSIKKTWIIDYDVLTVDEMVDLQTLYDMLNTQPYLILTIYDASFGVTTEQVHMDISDRIYLPGTNKLSSVSLTFIQIGISVDNLETELGEDLLTELGELIYIE